jgi:PKD domain
MACHITITEVVGVGADGAVAISIAVGGTAVDCRTVVVKLFCPPDVPIGFLEADVAADGTWEVEFVNLSRCECGGKIHVEAECKGNRECRDTFDGPLECTPPEQTCPEIGEVTAEVSDCNADGTRTVIFTATVTNGTGDWVVVHWEVDGDADAPAVVADGASVDVSSAPHDRPTPGPVTGRLVVDLPAGCPAVERTVELAECAPPECPAIDDVLVTVSSGCNADGTRNVTLNAVLSGGPPRTYRWEFGDGDDQTIDAVAHPSPATTHAYPAPGNSPSEYTVSFTVTNADGTCIDTSTALVTVPGCQGECPSISELRVEAGACNADGTRRTMVLDAEIDGGGVTEFDWSFGDGDTRTIDATVTGDPSTSHDYVAPGDYTAELTLLGPEGCESSATVDVHVEACPAGGGGGGGGGGGDGGPSWCGAFTFAIAALLAVTLAFTLVLLTLQLCLAVPVPPWLWGVLAGLAIATALLIGIAYLLCSLGICPCLTACDWMAIAWMVSLSGFIVALYLSGCCVMMVVIAGVLFAAALAMFLVWLKECDPSRCEALDHALVAVVSGAAPVLAVLIVLPPIAACGLGWVEVGAGILGGILAVAVAACHAGD